MILIKDINILPVSSSPLRGNVLIDGGKISEISTSPINVEDCIIIECTDKTLTPGFIDIHTHQGLLQAETGPDGIDLNEKGNPVTPHLRALDGINPYDKGIEEAPSGGVTAINTSPGSMNVFPGMTALIKTTGTVADEMALKPISSLKISLGENPKHMYGKKGKSPSTRMGTAAILREWFYMGQAYLENRKNGKAEINLKLEAISKALTGEIPVHAHCHRSDDIVTAIRIAEEFSLNLLIVHGTEGHLILDYLKEKNYPIAVGPSFVYRNKPELKEMSFATPGILSRAGIKTCLISDTYPSLKYFQSILCTAIKEGMDMEEALKAVTLNPAEILGVSDRIGSIEKGKDADLIIWNGDPRDYSTTLKTTIIGGEIIYSIDEKHRS